MSKNLDVGKVNFARKPSSKRGPLEKSRYACGSSPKNRKKTTRGGNISRTWTNKSLNKSRVLARSLHTNNRTLAKKLNAVLVELSNCEETAAALRDDNEQLRQGTRFKDEAIEDLNKMIGQIAQLLVSAGKRAQDALAWPQLETQGDTFTLETSGRLEEVKEQPSLSPEEPPSGTEEPQNPFQKRDRIPRTPVMGDDEDLPSEPPAQDSVSDLLTKPAFSATGDRSLSPVAVPDIDRLTTASVSASTAPAVPTEAPPPAVISPIGRTAAPLAKGKGTMTKRKERGTFSKAPNPPVPRARDNGGDPALAVYDFSMSDTMNQTNQPVPSLADLRAQSESTSGAVAAVSKEQKGIKVLTELSQSSETVKAQSESSELVSVKVKKAASAKKVGSSTEASVKKRTQSKTAAAKEKGSKASKEKTKASKATSEKPNCIEETEKIDSAEPSSEKCVAHESAPDLISEKKEDHETVEKTKDAAAEEPDEFVKGAKRCEKKRIEDDDVVEAPKPKLMKKEKAKTMKEELCMDLEDAEDFEDFVPRKLSREEVENVEKKLKPMVEEEEEEGKENEMKKKEELTKKKRKKVDEEAEEDEKKKEVKKEEKHTKKRKKVDEEAEEDEMKKEVKKEEKHTKKRKKVDEEAEEDEKKKEEKHTKKRKKVEEAVEGEERQNEVKKEERISKKVVEEQAEKEEKLNENKKMEKKLTKKVRIQEKEEEEEKQGEVVTEVITEEKKKTKVEEKEGKKENTKKKVEMKLRKKTKKAEEEEEKVEGEKENAPVNVIGRAVRICGIQPNSEKIEKKKKFRRIVCADDSDDSLIAPNSAKKAGVNFLLETPRHEAPKTDEKDPLANSDLLNSASSSCNRPRRAKVVSLKEPSARGKLRRGNPEWCRTNV